MSTTTTLPGAGTKTGSGTDEQLTPMFNVVLLDDDEHTYDYVIEMLCRLFLLTEAQAYERAVEVDSTGRTIVITCELPQAEFGRDQIYNRKSRRLPPQTS
jgi:ATP-dependent Clp protease adaptor protein ClpS